MLEELAFQTVRYITEPEEQKNMVQAQTSRRAMEEKKNEDPNMSAYNFSHLIFDEDTKNISWRRENIFNKCFWENWMSTCRRMKLDLCLSP